MGLTKEQNRRRWEGQRRYWERVAQDERRDAGQRAAAAQAARVCARQIAALQSTDESQRPGGAGPGRY